MNTRHARMILTIIREKSFTAAAKALSITQPTLSQTVRQIETQLMPEHAQGTGAGTVGLAGALLAHMAQQVEIWLHGDTCLKT